MRNRFRVLGLTLAFLMASPLLHGQTQQSDDSASYEALAEEVENLNRELTDFTRERREQLMSDIDSVLAGIDDRIAALEGRLQEDWNELDRVARAEAQTALASLRRERSRVNEWHQRMKDSADFTWESMKEGFNDAFDGLAEAWMEAEQDVTRVVGED